MSLLEKLIEGYKKNDMRVEIADAPAWMQSVDKLIIVRRTNSNFIVILHCFDSKKDKIVATF